jgi:hypothetical protein
MSVRVKRWAGAAIESTTRDQDVDLSNRETTVDGQTFHWATNQVRNFLDESVGQRHAAFYGGASIIQEDPIAFGDSRF